MDRRVQDQVAAAASARLKTARARPSEFSQALKRIVVCLQCRRKVEVESTQKYNTQTNTVTSHIIVLQCVDCSKREV